MRFSDERDESGVLDTVVRILPAFGVGVLLSVLAAATWSWGVDLERWVRHALSTSTRAGLALVGLVSGVGALAAWRRPFSRALWLPTLLVPVVAFWDVGLIAQDSWTDPQLVIFQHGLREAALEATWRSTGGALAILGAFLAASLRLGRPLPSPSQSAILALGFMAVVGIRRWAIAIGMQFLLPGLVLVALLTYLPHAAFFDRRSAALPRAIRALATAPMGVLVSLCTTTLAATSALAMLLAVNACRGQTDVMRSLIELPTDPGARFLAEALYTSTHTSGALLLFAIWVARVEGQEGPAELTPPGAVGHR